MTTSIRTETYGLLESWLLKWEELLKKPADILLKRSFLNIVQPTALEIRRSFVKKKGIERSAPGWGRVLLGLLEQEINDNTLEVQFVGLQYPAEVKSLGLLLRQGTYDVSQVYPLLKKIEQGLSFTTILSGLHY